MSRGVRFTGALSVLLCGFGLAALFIWRRSSAPDGAGAAGFVSVSPLDDRARSPSSEALEVTASEPSKEALSSNRVQAEVIPSLVAPDQAAPAGVDRGFLPYPNGGEAAFKRRYEGLDVRALGGTMLLLQQRLNGEVDHLVEDRYSHGLFDEKIYPSAESANSDNRRSDLPAGMGKSWPCERGTLQPDGSLKRWTTVLSEAEYPELFAHQAEYLWVVHEHRHKNRLAEGH
jgi:hypothetical protein